jgi:hypothetical protein
MAEHPTQQELDEYCRRVLAPAAFLSIHRHVTSCPRCAEQCNTPEHLARDLAHLRESLTSAPDETPYHLSTAEVTAYVQGTLNDIDLEIAESHLETCSTCLSEVRRHEAEGQPVHITTPASRPTRWFSLSSTNGWQPMRFAGVALFGVAMIFSTLWFFRSKPAEHNAQTAVPAAQSSSSGDAQTSSTPAPSPNDVPRSDTALVLNDGDRQVTMDQRGTLAGLEQLPVGIQEKVGTALQAGRLEPPAALSQLASERSTLLSESGNGLPFSLLGPMGEVVRSQRPIFRWRALAGAQSYKVVVTDADLNEVATSDPVNTTEWRITKPLPPGGIYSWQVTALKDGLAITSPTLPAPQAKFKIIDRSTSGILQQAERSYPKSHLTLGVLYAEAGLLDDAEQEFRVLVRDNPRAGVAQKLLRSVQAMRAARTSPSGRS